MTTMDFFPAQIMITTLAAQMISGETMNDLHLPLAILRSEVLVNLNLKEIQLVRAWRCLEVATNKGHLYFSPEMSLNSSPNQEEEDKNHVNGGINMISLPFN